MRGVSRGSWWLVGAVLAAVGLGFAPAPITAAEKKALGELLDEVFDGPDYRHATWGVLAVNAKTGETVYSRNPDAMVAPASVTKLFTCAAALVTLGPDSTAETAVFLRGLVVNGALRGDLILVASGDLTFGGRLTPTGEVAFRDHDHTYANSGLMDTELTDTDPLAALNALATQIHDLGITRVEGEILVDDRLFARTRGSGSGPDVVSPMLVNDNVIDVVVKPGKNEGDPAVVTTRPETSFYQVDALVTTAAEGAAPEIRLATVDTTHFAVRGRVPAGGKPQVRIYPVEEPALFARALFVEALRRNGVRATAAVLRPGNVTLPPRGGYAALEKVAAFTSPPLRDAVKVTLKVSHNLYASTLPCLIAVSKGGLTAEAGMQESRRVWRRLGVDVNAVSFGGGAGGSPADHVTPRATVQLIQGMARRPEWDAFRAGLPLLGVDGTLVDVVKKDSPARGKVAAKTGTLVWYDAANDRMFLRSKAVAGAMTTKAGTPLVFAVFVNNVPLPKGVTAMREGKVLGRVGEILYENGP